MIAQCSGESGLFCLLFLYEVYGLPDKWRQVDKKTDRKVTDHFLYITILERAFVVMMHIPFIDI